MTQSSQKELAELSALVNETERMLELARAGEWEQVMGMEADRRPRLEAFFNSLDQSMRERYADQLRQAIEHILKVDKEVLALGEAAKTEAAELLRQSQSGRKATTAYRQNDAL